MDAVAEPEPVVEAATSEPEPIAEPVAEAPVAQPVAEPTGEPEPEYQVAPVVVVPAAQEDESKKEADAPVANKEKEQLVKQLSQERIEMEEELARAKAELAARQNTEAAEESTPHETETGAAAPVAAGAAAGEETVLTEADGALYPNTLEIKGGWHKILHEDSGLPYFFNPDTGVTQWDSPHS